MCSIRVILTIYIPTISIPHYSLDLGSCVVPRRFRYRLLSWSLRGDVDKIYDPDRVDYIAYKAHVILGTEWLFKGGIPAVYSDI